MPVDPAEPVVTAACIFFCRRAMGEAITRHSPRPLQCSRANDLIRPGRECVAGSRRRVYSAAARSASPSPAMIELRRCYVSVVRGCANALERASHPGQFGREPRPPCRRIGAGGKQMSYSDELHKAALAYHRLPRPGKLEIQAIKPLANQRDLALAYSPGVAAPCMAISANPAEAASLTIRANLVAVVSNGTAVLGLGNIGPLASKPVMEGKAVLFKKFAGIDVFDIEIAADTIERVVETVAALEPTFGGINLEDIKGPECFEIEAQLKARMKIPVFHDDQHGTAIIVAAAITNGLLLNGKKSADCKIVASGAGAAAIACLNLLVSLGAQRKNIWV